MNCEEIGKLLTAFHHGELTDEEDKLVENHIASCRHCQAELKAIASLQTDLRSTLRIEVEKYSPSPLAWQRLQQYISRHKREKRIDLFPRQLNRKTRGTAWKWLRPVLVSIPVIAIMIALFIIQPWNTTNNSKGLLADIISASENIQSYRKSVSSPSNEEFWEFVLPDRLHGIMNRSSTSTSYNSLTGVVVTEIIEHRTEYYIIGDKIYYLSDNAQDMSQENTRNYYKYVWGIPTIEYVLGKLQFDWELKQLPDENIDGIDYLHYEATSRVYDTQTEFLIDQDGSLVRERIQRYKSHGTIESNSIKYYDFNTDISIEPPLAATGELLPGWEMMDIESRTPWVSVDEAIKAISGSEDWSDPDTLMEAFEMIYRVEDPIAYINALPPEAQDALYDFHVSLHERTTEIVEVTTSFSYNDGVLHYTNSSGVGIDVVVDTGEIDGENSGETIDTTAIVDLWVSAILAPDPQAYFDALPDETQKAMAIALSDDSISNLITNALY